MPFSGVPDAALAVGLAAVTLAVLASVVGAVVFRDVPRPVPVHWGIAGPDRFGSQITAALWFLGPLVALNALALWRFFRGSAARTERALWIAGLAFAIAVLAGSYAGAIAWALTGHQPFPSGVPVLVGLVLLFAVLAGYSRLGLAAEWRQARVR